VVSIEHFHTASQVQQAGVIKKTNELFGESFNRFTFPLGRTPMVVRLHGDKKILGALSLQTHGEFPIISHLYMTTPGYVRLVNGVIERYLASKNFRRVGGWCTQEMVDFYKKFGATIQEDRTKDDGKKVFLMAKWL
jgi:hypothetical protein